MKKSIINVALSAAALVAAAVPATATAAAVINGMLQLNAINQIQDTDAERVRRTDAAGAVTTVTDGTFQVGDIIESVLRFDTVNNNTIADTFGSPYRLGAYSQLRVASVVNTGVFVPTAEGPTEVVKLIFGATGNLGANVVASIYERTSNAGNYNFNTQSAATAIANLTAGTKIIDLGFADTDDFWVSDAINDISVIANAIQGSTQQANGVFGLSMWNNTGSIPFVSNGIVSGTTGTYHDVVGSSSIYVKAPATNDDWLVSSNTEVSIYVVPEPGALLLSGMALLALFASTKRRNA